MPDLSASGLEPYSDRLFSSVTCHAGLLPTRLALNVPLAQELDRLDKWFYGRTFPLWAAGKVTGLRFNSSEKPDCDAILLGSLLNANGAVNEIEQAVLVGQDIPPWPEATLHGAIIELLATEFCHRLGLSASRILCLILDTGRPGNPTLYGTRVSRLPFTIAQLRQAHQSMGAEHIAGLIAFITSRIGEQSNPRNTGVFPETQENELVDAVLQAAGLWQAEGFYCSNASLNQLTLAGELRLCAQSGFIETLTDEFCTLDGTSVPISEFHDQPGRVVELCIELSALVHLGGEAIEKEEARSRYEALFNHYYHMALLAKLGLRETSELSGMLTTLLDLLKACQVNYADFFHLLSMPERRTELCSYFKQCEPFNHWLSDYQRALTEFGRVLSAPRQTPSGSLTHHHIEATLMSLQEGNRNAVDNMLESIQSGRPLMHYHWASEKRALVSP